MSKNFYRQCTLTRQEGDSEHRLVTWIPERKNGVDIVPGVKIQVHEHGEDKDPEAPWWTVKLVGNTPKDEKSVKERAHNWTKYRAATDV